MLLTLVYVSRATSPMSPTDLVALRDQSSEHNLAYRITGLLLHRDGTFLQDLEGPEESVLDLYARIRQDARHEDVTLVWTQPQLHRRFPRWSMALLEPGDATVEPDASSQHPVDPDLPEAALVRELLDLFEAHGSVAASTPGPGDVRLV